VATDCLGLSAPIQRCSVKKPGTRCRAGMCSVSYQSLNSSAATFEKSIAAISAPFAMAVPPLAIGMFLRQQGRAVHPDRVARALKARVAPAGVSDGKNLDIAIAPAIRDDVGADDKSAHAWA